MTPDDAPRGAVMALGVNGRMAVKGRDDVWRNVDTGEPESYDDVHKGGRVVAPVVTETQVSVIHRHALNMGDHGEMVGYAVALEPDETVEHLVARLLKARSQYQADKVEDVVELRIMPAPQIEKPADPWAS